jgi:hypothetical protein
MIGRRAGIPFDFHQWGWLCCVTFWTDGNKSIGQAAPPMTRLPLRVLAAGGNACGHFTTRRQDSVAAPELAMAGERFALIESNRRCWGPNGVSEWV